MTERSEIGLPEVYPTHFSRGIVKLVRDTWCVVEMKALFLLGGWYWYIIRPLVFPLGVLFWLRIMVPDDPEMNRRILAGAVVFGVSLSTANLLTQQILQDRFLGRLKLLITMPMSKASYAVGVIAVSTIQAVPIVVVLLAFSPLVGVELALTWALLPLIISTLLGISGIALLIASHAPSIEIGGIMANLFGVVLVMVSPVFFTMDQAPLILQLLGWISPMRYAADGITKSASGDSQIWIELVVLLGFAIVSMTLGLWKLRWRED